MFLFRNTISGPARAPGDMMENLYRNQISVHVDILLGIFVSELVKVK